MIDPIALAIPVFFVAMGAELALSARRGRLAGPRPDWRAADALADLGCGIFSQVTGLLTSGLLVVAAYLGVYAFAPNPLPASPAVWLFAFVAYDLVYYVWHRASHRVNVLWAAHAVHHQSEDYNLAVALRQAVFTPLTALPFHLPLALLGVPPGVYLAVAALNQLYQFWIHTRLVGKLGPVELVMNTPSHHRVHHGVNPRYIDKNHAGVFIVWDRLFGTFEEETEEPVYGVVEGFGSADVLRANLDPWRKLWALSRQCRGWDRLRAWFMPPEWRPAYLGGPVTIPTPRPTLRWDPAVPRAVATWGAVWMTLSAAALVALLVMPLSAKAAVLGIVIAWTTVSWGARLDESRHAAALEKARLWALPLAGIAFGPVGLAGGAVLALTSRLVFGRPVSTARAAAG